MSSDSKVALTPTRRGASPRARAASPSSWWATATYLRGHVVEWRLDSPAACGLFPIPGASPYRHPAYRRMPTPRNPRRVGGCHRRLKAAPAPDDARARQSWRVMRRLPRLKQPVRARELDARAVAFSAARSFRSRIHPMLFGRASGKCRVAPAIRKDSSGSRAPPTPPRLPKLRTRREVNCSMSRRNLAAEIAASRSLRRALVLGLEECSPRALSQPRSKGLRSGSAHDDDS